MDHTSPVSNNDHEKLEQHGMASVSESDIVYASSGLLDFSSELSIKCDNSNIRRSATCLAGVSSTPMSNNNMNAKLKIYPPNTPIAMSSLIDSVRKSNSDADNLNTALELLKESNMFQIFSCHLISICF